MRSSSRFAGKNGIDGGESDDFRANVKTLQISAKWGLLCALLRRGLIQTKQHLQGYELLTISTAKLGKGPSEISEKDPMKGKKTLNSNIAIGLNHGARNG